MTEPFRAPVSILAVRPATRAPPPFMLPPPSQSPPRIPTRSPSGVVPVPVVVPIIPPVVSSPGRAIVLPSVRSINRVVTPPIPASVADTEEGRLFPIVPNPYKPIQGSSSGIPSRRAPGYEIIVPTVPRPSLPVVIPTVPPRSPPGTVPKSQIADLGTEPPVRPLPTAPTYSYPAIMTGRTPPIGEETPITVPIPNISISPLIGAFAYIKPVDVASYSISNESFPLPLEETQRPVILASAPLSIGIPTPTSYRTNEILSPNLVSPSLRFNPPIVPRSPTQGLAFLSPRVPSPSRI